MHPIHVLEGSVLPLLGSLRAPASIERRMGMRGIYREVLFQLSDGTAATALFRALSEDPQGRTRIQTMSLGADYVSDLIDYEGPIASVDRVREVLSRPEPTAFEVDSLIDEECHVRFLSTWSRPMAESRWVSLEHILFDVVGPGALMFCRIEAGAITYKVAAPGGRGLSEFLDRAQAAFGTRWTIKPVRAGVFKPGWEIEDAAHVVRPEDTALLAAALAAGYYDEPKRCGVRELGSALGLSKSVIARRLRLLERRALERLVG